MRVATLGAGAMTRSLGAAWVRAGHEVFIGGRTKDKAARLAEEIGAAGCGSLREAAEFGEAVLLAVRIAGLAETLAEAGAGEGTLAGKTVIDCGNAVDVRDFSRITFEGRSGAEQAARLAPGAHLVKAFNQAEASVWRMDPPEFDGRRLAVPYAGDEAGKEHARTLIRDVGAEPLDAGDLSQTGHLEAMAAVMVRLLFAGYDPLSVFAFVSPGRTREPFTSR